MQQLAFMTITTHNLLFAFSALQIALSAKIIFKTNVGISFRVTVSHVDMEVPMDPGKPQVYSFAIVLKITCSVRDSKAET